MLLKTENCKGAVQLHWGTCRKEREENRAMLYKSLHLGPVSQACGNPPVPGLCMKRTQLTLLSAIRTKTLSQIVPPSWKQSSPRLAKTSLGGPHAFYEAFWLLLVLEFYWNNDVNKDFVISSTFTATSHSTPPVWFALFQLDIFVLDLFFSCKNFSFKNKPPPSQYGLLKDLHVLERK